MADKLQHVGEHEEKLEIYKQLSRCCVLYWCVLIKLK